MSPAAANSTNPDSSSSLARSIVWILAVFVLSRLMLLGVGYMAHTQMTPRMDNPFPWHSSDNPAINMWAPWDSGWYIGLAQWGYMKEPPYDEDGNLVERNYAFFPAYPMLVSLLGEPIWGKELLVPGLIISNLLTFGGLVFLYLICKHLLKDEEIARNAALIACFFPNSFVFSSFYTESLFLFLLTGVIYMCLKERWLVAGLMGAALSGTRINGLTVGLPVVFLILSTYPELLKGRFSRDSIRAILSLLLYPIGLIAFMIHLNYRMGDPLGFLTVAGAWHREPGFYLPEILIGPFHGHMPNRYLAFYTLVAFILIHTLLFRKQWLLYITSIILIAPALLNGSPGAPFMSMPRFLLVVFPLYIAIAQLVKDRPRALAMTTACLALLNGMLMVYWVTGMNLVV